MTIIESISFSDVKLKERLETYLKSSGKKRSKCVNEAIDEYLQKRGV